MKTVKHDQIYPNPDQPRKSFNSGKLEELAQSIKACGLMEPIVCVKKGKRFMIVAGERRWRACLIAGLLNIPVRIIKANKQKIAELALLENIQREDLNIIEEANAYRSLVDIGLSVEEIAGKMGMKYTFRIEWRLSLLNLEKVYQDYTVKGILTPTQAREMSRLPKEKQGILFDMISAGKAKTQNKLTATVNAMLYTQEQESFLPEPLPVEREVNSKYDRMIESIVSFINQAFNRDDLSVLSAVLTPAAHVNIERIDLIIFHLNKIKRALLQADSRREVLEQTTIAA
ncbi:MAG: ParB/RepB/Spo0J family partition protein [Syntrophales bacterium]|nr:ParB/RepB/Spo0J family partition protein [Syntrophales bacterium]